MFHVVQSFASMKTLAREETLGIESVYAPKPLTAPRRPLVLVCEGVLNPVEPVKAIA